jgi:predicted nucleotidyltransferase
MDLKFFLEDLFGRPCDLVLEDSLKEGIRAKALGEVRYA